MGKSISWGNQIEEMMVMMMVLDMGLWKECMLEKERGVVVGEAMVIV